MMTCKGSGEEAHDTPLQQVLSALTKRSLEGVLHGLAADDSADSDDAVNALPGLLQVRIVTTPAHVGGSIHRLPPHPRRAATRV